VLLNAVFCFDYSSRIKYPATSRENKNPQKQMRKGRLHSNAPTQRCHVN
jgi:hypothetical protein